MRCVGEIASGVTSSLLSRVADVVLKEGPPGADGARSATQPDPPAQRGDHQRSRRHPLQESQEVPTGHGWRKLVALRFKGSFRPASTALACSRSSARATRLTDSPLLRAVVACAAVCEYPYKTSVLGLGTAVYFFTPILLRHRFLASRNGHGRARIRGEFQAGVLPFEYNLKSRTSGTTALPEVAAR